MVEAKYILRCDDAAEYMNITKWNQVFDICDEWSVKPIIAVIPLLKDPNLLSNDFIPDFWTLVKTWEDRKYTIAMHGLNHLYLSKAPGLITPRPKSEFSGLSLKSQKLRIRESLEIFKRNNISPNVFVAPGHSFDKNTLLALRSNGIDIISDGFFNRPMFYRNMNWIPQQLWKGELKKTGVWTICLHPNTITSNEISDLKDFINVNHTSFITAEELSFNVQRLKWLKNILIHRYKVSMSYLKYGLKAALGR